MNIIANDRMTQSCQMDADLMHPASAQFQFQDREIADFPSHLEPSFS